MLHLLFLKIRTNYPLNVRKIKKNVFFSPMFCSFLGLTVYLFNCWIKILLFFVILHLHLDLLFSQKRLAKKNKLKTLTRSDFLKFLWTWRWKLFPWRLEKMQHTQKKQKFFFKQYFWNYIGPGIFELFGNVIYGHPRTKKNTPNDKATSEKKIER